MIYKQGAVNLMWSLTLVGVQDAGMSRMTKSCDFVLDLGVAARVGDADAILSRRSLLEAPPPLKVGSIISLLFTGFFG